jgi:ADP-ribose pyrophosphatase YjhB (NUDIX family)
MYSSMAVMKVRTDYRPEADPAAFRRNESTDRVNAARFCAECGGSLEHRWLEVDHRTRQVCVLCGSIHYENPRILVSCYMHWRDRVVFCRRAQAPARGLWALPAGFVEMSETLEEGVVREIREETGLLVDPRGVALFRLISLPHISEVYVEFRVELSAEPTFSPGHETLEVALFSEHDVPRDELAFGDVMPSYPDEFFKCVRMREFPIKSVPIRPVGAG